MTFVTTYIGDIDVAVDIRRTKVDTAAAGLLEPAHHGVAAQGGGTNDPSHVAAAGLAAQLLARHQGQEEDQVFQHSGD